MSLEVTIARIAELHSVLAPQPATTPATPATTSFAGALQGASAGLGTAAAPAAGTTATLASVLPSQGTGAGQAVLNLVRGEVGQAEQPPGSNDSPRIAQYRQATAGSGVGPWCAYFVSWAARQAGVPLGDSGQGFGRVDDVYAWAQRTGKAIPAGSAPPQPGDLIVWDEHIGVVENVLPDGRIQTIEGNSSDQVARRTYDSGGGGAVGFVRLG
jgi:cell wall-associated NlpC family hydrolase